MNDQTKPRSDQPGFGREIDLEADRGHGRPAKADMDAAAETAARDPLTVSPDPEDETSA